MSNLKSPSKHHKLLNDGLFVIYRAKYVIIVLFFLKKNDVNQIFNIITNPLYTLHNFLGQIKKSRARMDPVFTFLGLTLTFFNFEFEKAIFLEFACTDFCPHRL